MIFTLLLGLAASVLTFVFGLLPTFDVPSWMDYEMDGPAFLLGSIVYKLGFWIPTADIGTVFLFLGVLLPVLALVTTTLFIFGLMPFFGKRFG
jgi:hypothetical protein